MAVEVWITEIEFSGGESLQLTNSEIVLLVGPNSAGKSITLREIISKSQTPAAPSKAIRTVKLHGEGTGADVTAWLESQSRFVHHSGGQRIFQKRGRSIFEQNAINQLRNVAGNGLGDLTPWLFENLGTESRLTAANPAQNWDAINQPPQHPIHFLYLSDELLGVLSAFVKRAFGHDLIVHRGAGNQIPLYVGESPKLQQGEDRTSTSYILRLQEVATPLHTQGDGVRSFVGVLLHAFVEKHEVLLIDEPEAFLHPPQARQLGQILATSKAAKHQIFMATHSGDLLRGALDKGQGNLRVIRIMRDRNLNHAYELNKDGIKALWSDPLLRQSNVLDGVFHEKTIVCEADGDCRVLSALTSAIWEARPDEVVPDVMWTHCGGKHRIPVVVRALRGLRVPTLVVTDFDVLREEDTVKGIVQSLGGDWQQYAPDWKIVSAAIGTKKPELETAAVSSEIDKILKGVKSPTLPKDAVEAVQQTLRRASGWAIVKETGKAYVPPGEATAAVERLLQNLRSLGLHVIEKGELEAFDRTIGGHGPEWVGHFLEKDLAGDPSLREAREFVERLLQ